MRILHIVTLVTPTGDYGGPIRVAENLASEQRRRGHEPLIAGGQRGFTTTPSEINGIPARLFPVRRLIPRTGFAGLVSPGLQRFLRRELEAYDQVHIHLARDLITLPAARLASRT